MKDVPRPLLRAYYWGTGGFGPTVLPCPAQPQPHPMRGLAEVAHLLSK